MNLNHPAPGTRLAANRETTEMELFRAEQTRDGRKRKEFLYTYIFPEEVVLQGAARVQPHAALRVLVREEEAVLRRRAQALDLRQLVPQRRARVHYRGLKWFSLYRKYFKEINIFLCEMFSRCQINV